MIAITPRFADPIVNMRADLGWTSALMDQVFIAGSTMDP